MILRCQSSKWLELSIGSDLGMLLEIWSLNKKRVSYLLIFVIQENEIFIFVICDPLFFSFASYARDPLCDPHMTTEAYHLVQVIWFC